MKQIKKRKKDKLIEREMKNPDLKRVCLEVLNQDNTEWIRKKRKIEIERKKQEEKEEEEMIRIQRINTAERKRKELLRGMRKKGILKPTKKDLEDIERRKEYWRRFREPRPEYKIEEDEKEDEAGDVIDDIAGCNDNATASLPSERKDMEYPGTKWPKLKR